MTDDDLPRVAVFRPADEREERAVRVLREHGFEALSDPLLEPRPTGAKPRTDADFLVLTSVTGVRLAADSLGDGDAAVCAIGPKTREAIEDAGVSVDTVPDEYTSEGLVDALDGRVDGARVEVARSDHGSDALTDGLNDADAYVHETVLYELARPERGGHATADALANGTLDGVVFTSSLTVEHLLDALEEKEVPRVALDSVVVGTIGEPTERTAIDKGVDVDVVAEEETFESAVEAVGERLR